MAEDKSRRAMDLGAKAKTLLENETLNQRPCGAGRRKTLWLVKLISRMIC
jgi:hypothetical protein